jgi:hypothetical protein
MAGLVPAISISMAQQCPKLSETAGIGPAMTKAGKTNYEPQEQKICPRKT